MTVLLVNLLAKMDLVSKNVSKNQKKEDCKYDNVVS